MQTINIEVIITLVIGVILGSSALSFRVVLLKSLSIFAIPLFNQKDKAVTQTPTVKLKQGNRYFDDLEIRLLQAILDQDSNGLGIANLNSLLNLTKLSEENQRQRRHLFLKELNLKLFLIFGVREGITRIESETDKRVKLYVLNEKIEIPAITDTIKAS